MVKIMDLRKVSGDLYGASVVNHWNPNILANDDTAAAMKEYEAQIEHAHDETA